MVVRFIAVSLSNRLHFGLEPRLYFIEAGCFDRRDFAKMMAMPNAMLAVISEHTTIVAAMDVFMNARLKRTTFPWASTQISRRSLAVQQPKPKRPARALHV